MTNKQLLTQAISVFGPNLFARLSQSQMCDALGLLDQKTMAAKLGLSYEAFRWRVAKGQIPKPELKLAKRAYYSQRQVEQISSDALEIPSSQLNTSGDSFMDDEDDEHGPQET